MAIPIINTTARYGQLTDPANETVVTCEFWIDPNTITMADDTNLVILLAQGDTVGGTTWAYYIRLSYLTASGYSVTAIMYKDSGSAAESSDVDITDGWHHIRVVWIASSDGFMCLYVDGTLEASITGTDNDSRDVDTITFGAASGLDAGTCGILYMDDCKWDDEVLLIYSPVTAPFRDYSLTAQQE